MPMPEGGAFIYEMFADEWLATMFQKRAHFAVLFFKDAFLGFFRRPLPI